MRALPLRQLIHELELLNVTLPDDTPVNVWLLAEIPGPLTLATMNISGVCAGYDKRHERACATLKLTPAS